MMLPFQDTALALRLVVNITASLFNAEPANQRRQYTGASSPAKSISQMLPTVLSMNLSIMSFDTTQLNHANMQTCSLASMSLSQYLSHGIERGPEPEHTSVLKFSLQNNCANLKCRPCSTFETKEGRKEGRKEERKEGKKEGRKEGRKEGIYVKLERKKLKQTDARGVHRQKTRCGHLFLMVTIPHACTEGSQPPAQKRANQPQELQVAQNSGSLSVSIFARPSSCSLISTLVSFPNGASLFCLASFCYLLLLLHCVVFFFFIMSKTRYGENLNSIPLKACSRARQHNLKLTRSTLFLHT